MKRLITTWIIALLVIPTTLLADNYTQLWKKVNEARDKDLPKTQIALLQSIIDKATAEQEYGHLLKAETMMATTWYGSFGPLISLSGLFSISHASRSFIPSITSAPS